MAVFSFFSIKVSLQPSHVTLHARLEKNQELCAEHHSVEQLNLCLRPWSRHQVRVLRKECSVTPPPLPCLCWCFPGWRLPTEMLEVTLNFPSSRANNFTQEKWIQSEKWIQPPGLHEQRVQCGSWLKSEHLFLEPFVLPRFLALVVPLLPYSKRPSSLGLHSCYEFFKVQFKFHFLHEPTFVIVLINCFYNGVNKMVVERPGLKPYVWGLQVLWFCAHY